MTKSSWFGLAGSAPGPRRATSLGMLLPWMACPVCKTLWPRSRVLCEDCATKIWNLRHPVHRVRFTEGLDIHSVFAWDRDSPKGVRRLVLSLKGQENPRLWLEPALWMLNLFGRCPNSAILVPVPSRGRNHALGLARALQHWTGWALGDGLRASMRTRQKLLSRKERQAVVFWCEEEFIANDFTTVIIVDDVVTTGATVAAAYRALGRPRNCKAWCLVDRRPCGRGRPLI